MTSDTPLVERAVEQGIELGCCAPEGSGHDTETEVLQALVDHLGAYDSSGFEGCFLATPEREGYFALPFPVAGMRCVLIDEDGGVRALENNDARESRVAHPPLAAGYYELTVTQGDAPRRFFVIVAPQRVYEPQSLQAGEKANGITLSLYSLRSSRNWGIGDFGDLESFVRLAADHELDFIGINPVHALFLSHPEWNSLYSPSSRRWLNPIYLDVAAIPAFAQSSRARRWFADPQTTASLAAFREARVIDYRAVWAVKKRALEMAFAYFEDADTRAFARARRAFARFVAEQGEALHGFALFETLDVHCHDPKETEETQVGWLAWPEAYRDPRSATVRAFAAAHEKKIRFHMWLQWLCDEQLRRLRRLAAEQGLSLGLYGDLALGAARGGADTWLENREYCLPVSVGAPPDPFAPSGQNWQLPPWHPRRLIRNGFQPFIEVLRANMRHYAMLRIDHVMGLDRLWWITHGATACHGAYVRYPGEAMMAVLALESHRARCVVIGENLGRVSRRMRKMLLDYGVYAYSVLRFARAGARYLAPRDYPAQALTVTSTHDLAPLGGYWSGRDLETMRQLEVFPDEDSFKRASAAREADKRALFTRLQEDGLLPEKAVPPRKLTPELRLAVQLFGAGTASRLYAIQIENLLPVEDNFNIPGVASGYPNWALKLPRTITEIARDRSFVATVQAVRQARQAPEVSRPSAANDKAEYPVPDSAERRLIDSLFTGENGDPFAYLGPHRVAGVGRVVRALQPGVDAVSAIDRDTGEVLAELRALDPRGLFVGVLAPEKDDYRLRFSQGEAQWTREDPYRFPSRIAAVDVWLFNEGRHLRPYQLFGAHLVNWQGVDGVSFCLWAPNARRVSVVGEFNSWDGRLHPMRFHPQSGIWELFLPGVAHSALYKFELRDAQGVLCLKSDPYAFAAELRPGTASVVRGLPEKVTVDRERRAANGLERPISIYEVHLGSWRRRLDNGFWLTYRELAEELVDYVAEMGFTHIELLPLSEFPFDGSWGYQTTAIYAPTSRFGSPGELQHLIGAAHRRGINVILDWVIGHFPSDEHALRRFDGSALYEHADPREGYHKDWNTLIYNFGRHEVANYLRGNALYWIERFGFDGLRVDAVSSMIYRDYSRAPGEWIANRHGGRENLEAIDFLRRSNTMLREEAPGVVAIAEESTAFPGVTDARGLDFDYKWNMGWMNDTLRYMEKDPVHRKYHHNLMTFAMMYQYSERFILPLSHDEVVHGKGSLIDRMPGDAWQKFANLRAYYGFMFGHPGKKLLFMGDEFAQGREWNYAEPLDWYLLEPCHGGWHTGVQRWVRDLNRVYRDFPALHQRDHQPDGFHWLVVDDADNSVFVFERRDRAGNVIVVLANFTPMVRAGYRFGVGCRGGYREILNSDAAIYRGSGRHVGGVVHSEAIGAHGRSDSLCLDLPPLATVFLEYLA